MCAVYFRGLAAGVTMMDISSPPETRRGATSVGKDRRWSEGKGVYGGHMDNPRTSWECIRLDVVRTHLEGDSRTESLFDDEDSTNENCVTFWSTPDVNTEVPSCVSSVNEVRHSNLAYRSDY